MPDYKEMYLIMTRASEKAMQILIEAQQKCEELYINDAPPSSSTPLALVGATKSADGPVAKRTGDNNPPYAD